jgi:formate dehydrogenase major subunit
MFIMNVSRRDFLRITELTAAGLALRRLGFDTSRVEAYAWDLRTRGARETPTICPYCAVGCGVICHTDGLTGKVIYTDGDSDHPINEGGLCAKGAALFQIAQNPNRITRPLYRGPYSDRWEPKSWSWTLREIARRVKKSRDASFVAVNEKGQVVNRTDGIAHVGSAALDNEECWLLQAMMRSLGLVYIEHQARI